MNYNELGNTNIVVSELGFGTSSIGGLFDPVTKRESIKTLRHAFDCGINYFDTSPCYGRKNSLFGPQTSELLLGEGLKGIARSEFILSTKAGKTSTIPPKFDFRYDSIIKSVENSLKNLQVEYSDIVILHDIEYYQGKHIEQALNEGLGALLDLKKQGKLRYVGISSYSMEILENVIDNYDLDVLLVHNHYNLIDDHLLRLLPRIQSKGIGLINASPFASGLLTSNEVPDWHPISEVGLEVIGKAIDFCRLNKVPIEKLALQFSLNNVKIPTTLFSCSNSTIISQNISWVEEPINTELIQELQTILYPVHNTDYDFGKYNH